MLNGMEPSRSQYLDHFGRVKYPYTLFSLIIVLLLGDFALSIIFNEKFLPEDLMGLLTYFMRISSVIFGLFIVRKVHYEAINVLIYYKLPKNVFTELSFLNMPKHHLLAGVLAYIVYVIVIYSGIFSPYTSLIAYHAFSNAFWVGIIGVGGYVGIRGLKMTYKFFKPDNLRSHVDPYHMDMMGGLRMAYKFFMNIIIYLFFAIGLWIGSIPYAFQSAPLLLLLCLGIALSLLSVALILHRLSFVLESVKNDKMKELYEKLNTIYKSESYKNAPLEEKMNTMIELYLVNLRLKKVEELRPLPDIKMLIIELLSGFLPVALQYVVTLF